MKTYKSFVSGIFFAVLLNSKYVFRYPDLRIRTRNPELGSGSGMPINYISAGSCSGSGSYQDNYIAIEKILYVFLLIKKSLRQHLKYKSSSEVLYGSRSQINIRSTGSRGLYFGKKRIFIPPPPQKSIFFPKKKQLDFRATLQMTK
jgi:hypothetical protein